MDALEPRPEERVDRRAIRAAVVEMILELHGPWGRRVFQNRLIPLATRRLPAVAVYTLREDDEVLTVSPRRYKRTLELVVEILSSARPPADTGVDSAAPSDGLDDEIDGIALEIERRLERDQTLGGLVVDSRALRWEYEPIDQGDPRLAFGRLVWQIEYQTEAGEEPESGFPPLREVQSSLGRPGSPDQALRDVHRIDP